VTIFRRDFMLQAIHIRKQFQRSGEVLRDVSFTLGDGEFLSVIGPSGAGKTTLFRILNGTELCSGGEVLYSGTHFEAARGREKRALQQGIGTIYQDFCLVENLSAIQNVLNACLPDMSLAASPLGAVGRAAEGGKPVVAHCEVDDLLRGGYIHDGEYCRAHGHKGICSESEWRQVERDIALAEKTGCQYHVCHVSTRESVELVRRAKARGLRVSCETAPHYLLLCDEDLQEDGRFKMNPPLRDQADQDALIEGLLDGTIDMLVTDHAPHSHEEKSKGLEKSAMGVVGLETSFAASYTHLVKKGILPLEKLVELMHTSPMRRFGCGTEIAVGQPADLTVFDLNGTYTVDPETFLTMGRATPFAGTCLTGACKLTMIGGEIVWKEDML